ncbi:MAG TPA: glycosyltransferase family 9 protein, partial [bacterium]
TRNFFYNLLAPHSEMQHHATERYLDIVRYIDIETDERSEVVNLNSDEREWAADFLADHGVAVTDLIIAVHIGADEVAKQWGVKKFLQVAKYLATHHSAKILVSWEEMEEDFGREFLSGLPFTVTVLSGLPRRSLAAVIYFADVLICNECEVMHLAASVGTPLVAIYCETDPAVSKPLGEEFVALEGRRNQPFSTGVDTVVEQALQLCQSHPKHSRFEAEDFDISEEVLQDYFDILKAFDE